MHEELAIDPGGAAELGGKHEVAKGAVDCGIERRTDPGMVTAGKADILWRDLSDGRVGLRETNGRAAAWAGTITTVDAGWHIVDTADFNGDGKADILIRNDDTRVGIWEMDGQASPWAAAIATVDNSWQIVPQHDWV